VRASILLISMLVALSPLGCDKLRGGRAEAEEGAAMAPKARGPLELSIGADRYTLTPDSKGYAVSGAASGRLKIQADRVKYERADGTPVAKVKQKEYGFKLYDASDAELVKAKRRGAGYKLTRANDSELATLEPGGGAVSAVKQGERWVVSSGGSEVASASGELSAVAASFLALEELSAEQRLAMALYHHEVAK
jgi:hypothetical protein